MPFRRGLEFHEALKDMPSRFQQLLNTVLQEFGQRAASVTMFGSRVKGNARPNSDYDMILTLQRLKSLDSCFFMLRMLPISGCSISEAEAMLVACYR